MTRFQNRIAVWSSLHELILVYESSHASVFGSSLYRVHNGTNPNRVRIFCNWSGFHQTDPKYCSMQPTHTNKYKYMLNTHTCIWTHTCTPMYTYIYKHTPKYTLLIYIPTHPTYIIWAHLHAHTQACTPQHPHKFMHILTLFINTHIHIN